MRCWGIDLDEALDELFATPPEGFVAARNALAKRLRADQQRDEAAAVAAYRRPNRLVWALDQLALDEDPSLEALTGAVDAVRDARGAEMRTAVADLRDAIGAAARAAAGHLEPSRTTDRADLAAALHTVVTETDAVEALARGRLLEVPQAGSGGFGFATVAGGEPAAKGKAKAQAKAKAKAGKPAGRKKAPKETSSSTKEKAPPRPDPLAVRRAQRDLRKATEAHEQAERALARAEKEAAAADAAFEEAEAAVDEAEAARRRAEDERRQAARSAEAAAESLDAARAREEAAAAARQEAEAAVDAAG